MKLLELRTVISGQIVFLHLAANLKVANMKSNRKMDTSRSAGGLVFLIPVAITQTMMQYELFAMQLIQTCSH